MNIFLMAKQIVDILHEFKILDYGIMIFAFGLFLYGFISKKIYKDVKNFVVLPDLFVVLLGVVYTFTIIRHPENSYNQYVKTMSAFAIYFLGRVYGDEIVNKSKGISLVAYIALYANFIYRIIEYFHEKLTGELLPTQTWDFIASGALYFYKTDLVIGVVVSVVFIYAFAKNNWFKYFTIFVIAGLLAFSTSARMGQMILIVEYVFILFMELRNKLNKNWNINEKIVKITSIVLITIVVAFIVVIQVSPIHYVTYEGMNLNEDLALKLELTFHSRHFIWWDAMNHFSTQNLFTRLFGIDLWSETMWNSRNDRFHCLYMKMIYSVGYIGVALFIAFFIALLKSLSEKRGKQIKYLTIGFWIMFLLIGWSMEAFEYTQMSWYPFVFAGAIMSKSEIKD